MQPDDPFPIERCSSRLKAAILAEFQGRCPTFQEVFSIPREKWLSVPGFGPTSLRKLEAIMGNYQGRMKSQASPSMTDIELLARLERLQRELERIRSDIRTGTGNGPAERPSPDKSDQH